MSRSKLQRTACVLVAVFALALPLAAQPRREVRSTLMERLLSAFRERLATPLAFLQADATGDPAVPADSTDSTTPADDTDGRAHIDPNG